MSIDSLKDAIEKGIKIGAPIGSHDVLVKCIEKSIVHYLLSQFMPYMVSNKKVRKLWTKITGRQQLGLKE